MHVDRACAEHELVGDLAVRATRCHQAHHLELATREAAVLVVGSSAPPESSLDRLAELCDLVCRLGGQRRGAEAAGGGMRLREPLDGGLALARRGKRNAGAELDLRSLKGDLKRVVKLGGAAELLCRGV